jgi:lipoyl synthase
MIPATTPEELLDIAQALAERGAKGFLLSGGSDMNGRVPLSKFLTAIREVKCTTDLKINAHIGLCNRTEISELVNSGIDSFSVDLYGSNETIQEVLGLPAEVTDYLKVISDLYEAGASSVAPHICVGIHGGKLKGEFESIEMLSKMSPKEMVLISLIPTSGTPYADSTAPGKEMMVSVVRKARQSLPGTKLMLGCMRSKKNRSWEYDLVAAGLDGIVLPSPSTVERLRADGCIVKTRSVCCSIP